MTTSALPGVPLGLGIPGFFSRSCALATGSTASPTANVLAASSTGAAGAASGVAATPVCEPSGMLESFSVSPQPATASETAARRATDS